MARRSSAPDAAPRPKYSRDVDGVWHCVFAMPPHLYVHGKGPTRVAARQDASAWAEVLSKSWLALTKH